MTEKSQYMSIISKGKKEGSFNARFYVLKEENSHYIEQYRCMSKCLWEGESTNASYYIKLFSAINKSIKGRKEFLFWWLSQFISSIFFFFVEWNDGEDAKLSLDIYQVTPKCSNKIYYKIILFMTFEGNNLWNGSLRKSCACHNALLSSF